MSDELKQQLNQHQVTIAQLNARLAANEQFTNSTLKDLLETKTNLNLYMQAHNELNELKAKNEAEINSLKECNQKLQDEITALKNQAPVNESELVAVMDHAVNL